MLRRKDFWIGFVAGCIVIFLYAWLSIWGTYMGLERAHLEREDELDAVRRIILYSHDIHSQREEAVEWNQHAIKPAPKEKE